MAAGTKDEEQQHGGGRLLEKALHHPARTLLRAELDNGPVRMDELADVFDQPLEWITYHYRVLEAVGGLPDVDATE